MSIRITDNSDNITGKVGTVISGFTSGLAGTASSSASSFDGSLQRALNSFSVSFKEANWPMNGWALASNYQIAGGSTQYTTEPNKTYIAEKDLLIGQAFGIGDSSVVNTQTGWFKGLKEVNPDMKILSYFTAVVADKLPSSGVGWNDTNYDLINSATRGTTQWYLRDASGNLTQAHFNAGFHRINCYCVQFQNNNSLGRNFAEQFLQEIHDDYDATNSNGRMLDYIDGCFADVLGSIPERVYEDGTVPRVSTSQDFNNDSSADSRTGEAIPADPNNEDGYGGARMHRRGAAQWVDIFRSIFGTDYILSHNGTNDGIAYDSALDPIEDNEFFGLWDNGVYEFAQKALGIEKSATGYDVNFNGFSAIVQRIMRIKAMINSTSHPWGDYGPHSIPLEFNLRAGPWTDIDYEFARFTAAIAVLTGVSISHAVNRSNSFPRLDEYQYDWGAPVLPHPRPGTLDTTTNLFTRRADDVVAGNARVLFTEFENVLWVLRYDYPTSGADAFGTGSAETIPLPFPTGGGVWYHPDFTTTYTNPNNSLLQTRNQQPSLNDGSGVGIGGQGYGTIQMVPASAVMLIKADS